MASFLYTKRALALSELRQNLKQQNCLRGLINNVYPAREGFRVVEQIISLAKGTHALIL